MHDVCMSGEGCENQATRQQPSLLDINLAKFLTNNSARYTPLDFEIKHLNAMISPADTTTEGPECCREQKLKLKATVAENIRLRQVLKDVTDINKRWQTYNMQQKEYIQRLQSNMDVLRGGEVKGLFSSAAEESSNVKGQTSLMDQAATLVSLRSSYENAVKENCRLQKELEELKKKDEEKKDERDKERAEMKNDFWSQDDDLREVKEEAELLRIQVRAHREDWQAEKAEKEEAKRKLQRAEEELLELRNKLEMYQRRLQQIQEATLATLDSSGVKTHETREDGWRPLRRTSSAAAGVNFKQNSLTSQITHNGQPLRIVSRGVSGIDSSSLPGDIELDGVVIPRAPGAPTKRTSPPLHRPPLLTREASSFELVEDNLKDMVSCPGCDLNFTTEHHISFLDHFEQCQKVNHGFSASVSD